MQIRSARPEDASGIRAVHTSAFRTSVEADIVEALQAQAWPLVSLVAAAGAIVGHVAFSPVTHAANTSLRLAGLGPLAVRPEHQRHGIGGALIEAGLAECRSLGFRAVVVLGHPSYYTRFGFAPASHWGIQSDYDDVGDAFMALELEPGALVGQSGVVHYHPAFAAVGD